MIYCYLEHDGQAWVCDKCGRRIGARPPSPLPCKHQQPDDDDYVCEHRGELLETHKCKTCGTKEIEASIYRCNLHGDRCVARSWTIKRRMWDRCCMDCPDFSG